MEKWHRLMRYPLLSFLFADIWIMQGEIGLTYDELSVIGSLRKPGLMGPYAMFEALLSLWSAKYSLDEVHSIIAR